MTPTGKFLSSPEGTRNLSAAEYIQHTLLRDYAHRLLTPPAGGEALLAARHADYYRRFARTQDWRAIEHAFDQIEHGWHWVQANAPEQIIDYVFAVRVFFNMRGRPLEHIAWQNIALTQARAANDRENEGVLLNNIAYVYSALGQKDKALDTYQQALAIHREVGNRWVESVTLFNIGLLLNAVGRTAEAVTYLEQNVALDEALGHPDLESDRATLNQVRGKLRGNG